MRNLNSPPVASLSRRGFLGATAAATVPFVLPSRVWAARPNEKLCHACIGVTRMGANDLRNLLQHERLQIVALCDVDAEHLATAAKLVPGARHYADWRELFAKEGDRIDSVNVTTPDHMHFPIAHRAIQLGKHVYCQKPMCHDVAEVRTLTTEAIAKGVVTQLGTQHASGIGDRMTVELIAGGAIGKVQHVYLCSNREAPNRIPGPRPAQGETPPPDLNWDLWIGTAPMRPYAPKVYHPAAWRGWQDFGSSWCGDMGCHLLDATWRSLQLTAPTSVVAEVEASWKDSPARRGDNWPQSEHITWVFPGNERIAGKTLTVEWFDGEFLPPPAALKYKVSNRYPLEAALLVGTEGALLQQINSGPLLLPAEKFRNYPRPKPTPRNHYHHFVDACLGRAKNESHFRQTGPMTETILLGSVAIRACDQKLQWEPAAMKIPNYPAAERYLRRQYREGWQVT